MKMFIPRNTILICTLQMDMVLIAFHFQKKKKKPMEVVGKHHKEYLSADVVP